MARAGLRLLGGWIVVVAITACGARSSLLVDEVGGHGGEGGQPCVEGTIEPCGTDVGECVAGQAICHEGVVGPCMNAIDPIPETCNGLDDDCDGAVDEDFHVGEACDGPDTDLCADDVMTCDGCTKGPNVIELCNGVDDDCDGITDADCEVGDCQPTLLVIGSTPSSPSCVDFPVMKGSTGVIEFPCPGGAVTAQIGDVVFAGTVTNGYVSMDGIKTLIGPDLCTWKTTHHITGNLTDKALTYWYDEEIIPQSSNPTFCWQPCTEVGKVEIEWLGL
jgi:hypothetical protein